MRGQGRWYAAAVGLVRTIVLPTCRRAVLGGEHLPASGPVIVAANHISHADPFPLALTIHELGRAPRFMGKSTLWRNPVFKAVLEGTRQIPVQRNTADASQALHAAVESVRQGECVVIYPEGTLTKDPTGWPMVARTGVGRLALLTGAPVVPLAIWGPQHLRSRWPRTPWRRVRVDVRVGPAVDLSAFTDGTPVPPERLEGQPVAEVTAAVMADVTALLAQIRGEAPPDVVYDHRAGTTQQAHQERRTA